MCGENGIVRLDDGGTVLGSGIDTELELGFLAVVNRQTLHQQGTEAGTSTTTERVENKETLEAGTVVGDAADLVQDTVDHFLADGVVTTGVVVRSVLLASDHLFGVEKASVGASADLVDHIGLQITVDSTGDIFSLA